MPSPPRNLPAPPLPLRKRIFRHAQRIGILQRLGRSVQRVGHVRVHAAHAIVGQDARPCRRQSSRNRQTARRCARRCRRSSGCSWCRKTRRERGPAWPWPARAAARRQCVVKFQHFRPPRPPAAARSPPFPTAQSSARAHQPSRRGNIFLQQAAEDVEAGGESDRVHGIDAALQPAASCR